MPEASTESTEALPDDLRTILDIAADIVVNDGFDAVSFNLIARRSSLDVDRIHSLFESSERLVSDLLNREYSLMYRDIIDNIDRDPLGGRVSHIYRYVLSSIYERPLARAIYVIDREGLNRVMKAHNGVAYVPQLRVRTEFVKRMQQAGTVRTDVDPAAVAAVISAVSAGTSLTAPYGDLDKVTAGLSMILARAIDTEQKDTSAGKRVFFDYAMSLVNGEPEH
ncbi:MAG TPA: hypothetical protein VNT53_04620 [Pseudolysinimonas sp.]|nr:hypothetical protein [Pseudolysinimonas sp.]